MSNETTMETVDAPDDTSERPGSIDAGPPPLVLIVGDDDLVCIDDTCLPADAGR